MKDALYFLVVIAVIFSSCERERSQTNNAPFGLPPVANAGPDKQFGYVPDTIVIDGSASTSTGGTISGYEWREISGPSLYAKILNASSKRTIVKNFMPGIYQFELTVIDDGGRYARDTVQIQIVKEYILSSVWKTWSDPVDDQNWIFIDPSNSFSIATMATWRAEVSVQSDSSSSWTVASPWDWHSGTFEPYVSRYVWYFASFPYHDSSGFIINSNPKDEFFDKPVKVKVKFY